MKRRERRSGDGCGWHRGTRRRQGRRGNGRGSGTTPGVDVRRRRGDLSARRAPDHGRGDHGPRRGPPFPYGDPLAERRRPLGPAQLVLQPPLHPTTTMRCSTRLTSRITSVYFGADLGTVAQGGEPMGTPVTEAFSTAQACRVVGVTYRQIDYWAHSRLVTPSLQEAAGSGTRRRYSFADLVELRVVKKLIDAGVDLRRVRTGWPSARSWSRCAAPSWLCSPPHGGRKARSPVADRRARGAEQASSSREAPPGG